MIEERNVSIVKDAEGQKIVLINDIVFKGKRKVNWEEVKNYLKGYVGDFYQIEENADKIQVEKIEHQQSISNNRGIQVTVMVHYLEK